VTHQVSHPYSTTGKIIVLYIFRVFLICYLLVNTAQIPMISLTVYQILYISINLFNLTHI
jgi:hypothetical protein